MGTLENLLKDVDGRPPDYSIKEMGGRGKIKYQKSNIKDTDKKLKMVFVLGFLKFFFNFLSFKLKLNCFELFYVNQLTVHSYHLSV